MHFFITMLSLYKTKWVAMTHLQKEILRGHASKQKVKTIIDV